MKRTLRKILRFAVPALAFLLQLWRGFRPYGPEPGFTMSGAASEPMVVWLCVKFRNQRCDRDNS